MLRAGDLVRVRSGGPLMTVTGVQGDQVNCSCADWNGRLEAQSFPIGALNLLLTMPRTDWGAKRRRSIDNSALSVAIAFDQRQIVCAC